MKKILSTIVIGVCAASVGLAQGVPEDTVKDRLEANRTQFVTQDRGKSIRTEIENTNRDVLRISVTKVNTPRCIDCPKSTKDNYRRIESAARQSDLIAIGTVTESTSRLTQREAFIFTDSQFRIKETWKGSVASKVLDDGGSTEEITVATPGGSLQIDGHQATVNVANETQLKPGHTYLLFLRYEPASHSYIPVAHITGFDITGERVEALSKLVAAPEPGLAANKTNYLADLRTCVARERAEAVSK